MCPADIIIINIRYIGFSIHFQPKTLLIVDDEPVTIQDIRCMASHGKRKASVRILEDAQILNYDTREQIDLDYIKSFNLGIFGRTQKSEQAKLRENDFIVNGDDYTRRVDVKWVDFDINQHSNATFSELNILMKPAEVQKKIRKIKRSWYEAFIEEPRSTRKKIKDGDLLVDANGVNPFEVDDIASHILSFIRTPVDEWETRKDFCSAVNGQSMKARNINRTFRRVYFHGNVKRLYSAWMMKRKNFQYQILPIMHGITFDSVETFVSNIAFMELVIGGHRCHETDGFPIYFNKINRLRITHKSLSTGIRKSTGIKNKRMSVDILVSPTMHTSFHAISAFTNKTTKQKPKQLNVISESTDPKGFIETYSSHFNSCISYHSLRMNDYNLSSE